jgi:hypothetical protein
MYIIVKQSKTELPLPSREEQRRLEKQGHFFATAREIQEAAEKGRKQQEKERSERATKFFTEKIGMIKHGHSCVKELNEQVENERKQK